MIAKDVVEVSKALVLHEGGREYVEQVAMEQTNRTWTQLQRYYASAPSINIFDDEDESISSWSAKTPELVTTTI